MNGKRNETENERWVSETWFTIRNFKNLLVERAKPEKRILCAYPQRKSQRLSDFGRAGAVSSNKRGTATGHRTPFDAQTASTKNILGVGAIRARSVSSFERNKLQYERFVGVIRVHK